jgi:hypothetical protein
MLARGLPRIAATSQAMRAAKWGSVGLCRIAVSQEIEGNRDRDDQRRKDGKLHDEMLRTKTFCTLIPWSWAQK